MTTDELARTVSMGVLATLLAFEFVAAIHSWLMARRADRIAAHGVLYLSSPSAIRTHLAARRSRFDAARWQYPVLRTTRHGRDVREAIRVRREERPRSIGASIGRRRPAPTVVGLAWRGEGAATAAAP